MRFPTAAGLRRLSLVAMLLLSGSATSQQITLDKDQEAQNLATFDKVWTTVRDKHYDPELGGVDWEAARRELRPLAAKAKSDASLRPILSGMLARLGQSHFAIIPRAGQVVASEESPLTPRSWGNGCGFEVRIDAGVARVAKLDRGSALEQAGVKVGWQVTGVAGKQLPAPCEFTGDVNFPLMAAIGKSVSIELLGPEEQQVQVQVPLNARRSRSYTYPGMPAQPMWIEVKQLDDHVGYISFSSFFDPALLMSQFNSAVESFMELDGIVLDLRGNPGGMGSMAVAMMSWFVSGEERVVGSMISRSSTLKFSLPRRPRYFKGRVAVLIDRTSGSSSEIFAAGLRDIGAGKLFGGTTAGAVLPSGFVPLPNGDSLQHVLANYITVKGEVLEGVGVAPDVKTNTRRTQEVFDDETILEALDWIYQED